MSIITLSHCIRCGEKHCGMSAQHNTFQHVTGTTGDRLTASESVTEAVWFT